MTFHLCHNDPATVLCRTSANTIELDDSDNPSSGESPMKGEPSKGEESGSKTKSKKSRGDSSDEDQPPPSQMNGSFNRFTQHLTEYEEPEEDSPKKKKKRKEETDRTKTSSPNLASLQKTSKKVRIFGLYSSRFTACKHVLCQFTTF